MAHVTIAPASWKLGLARLSLAIVLVSAMLGGFRTAHAATGTQSDAVGTVQTYYSAIDAFDYETAWNQFGSAWQKQQPLDQFTKGFSDTAFVRLETTGAVDAGNGMWQVAVRLTSWHNDGKVVTYAGHYNVGQEGGQWRLISAQVALAKPSQVNPPLCKIADLAFSLGPWDAGAGSRFSSVIATNTGTRTCVAGGAPRVIATDTTTGKVVRSKGDVGAAPDAIVLKAGEQAVAPIRLGNWCFAKDALFAVTIQVPGDDSTGTVDIGTGLSIPPCLGESQPAGIGVQGFQLPPS